MPKFNVVVYCPQHEKEVLLTIEAKDETDAEEKVSGMRVPCPWGPINVEPHEFVVEKFRFPPEPPAIFVREYPKAFKEWRPPATLIGPKRELGVLTSIIEVPELPIVPAPPEAVYVMPTQLGERVSTKLEWWEPAEYRKEVEKFRAEWRKRFEEAARKHEEERLKAKEEHERRLREFEVLRPRLTAEEIERRRRADEEWRAERERWLKENRDKILETATRPVDAITIIPAEEWMKIKDMIKRLKEKLE